ncbi:MAG: LexA family transcriptional regulator [Desulfopila sp.]
MIGKNLAGAIKRRRKDLHLTQEQMASLIDGISRQGVQKWESGSIPEPSKWRDIERALEVEEGWIASQLYGRPVIEASGSLDAATSPHQFEAVGSNSTAAPELDTNIAPAPIGSRAARRIPIISWVQAGAWQEVDDPFHPGDADEWIDTTATGSAHAFALTVHGNSMEPEFHEGDIIVVDPERQAESGNYVIAKNGSAATFKQLILDGSSVYLRPLNSKDYRAKDMTGIDFRVVGVVVEKRKSYV